MRAAVFGMCAEFVAFGGSCAFKMCSFRSKVQGLTWITILALPHFMLWLSVLLWTCLFVCFFNRSVEGKQKPYRTAILHQLFKYSLSMQITAVLENTSPFVLSLLVLKQGSVFYLKNVFYLKKHIYIKILVQEGCEGMKSSSDSKFSWTVIIHIIIIFYNI